MRRYKLLKLAKLILLVHSMTRNRTYTDILNTEIRSGLSTTKNFPSQTDNQEVSLKPGSIIKTHLSQQ